MGPNHTDLSIDTVVDPHDRDLAEVRGAVQLVASGVARRVVLSGLYSCRAVAPAGLALAQKNGVAFQLVLEGGGAESIIVGPRQR